MTYRNEKSLNGQEFHTSRDARSFLDASAEFLHRQEDLNATVISTAELISGGSSAFRAPYWFGTIRDKDAKVTGCALHALPDGLTITGIGATLARRVFDWVSESDINPKRITSEPEFADTISDCWRNLKNKTVAMEHSWNVYRLDAASSVDTTSGNGFLRLGRKDEVELVKEWGNWYAKEKPAFLNVGEFFRRKLELGELLVWDDNGPTSIMTLSARTQKGIRISGVYTPLRFRGMGYASSMVAEVCKLQLAEGREFVTLSAQNGDPVERLYCRLGFYIIGERKSITFDT